MKVWFKTKTQGEFRTECDIEPQVLYDTWKAWQTGYISSFRINVKIGRYPRSIHVENLQADRTFREVIEANFKEVQQPKGEMASWPPSAA